MTEHLDKDIRREQILDAASRMFVNKGFEESTVDEIAREANLSKGSIYWYFKSKLEILIELMDRCVMENQQQLVKLVEQNQFGPEALYKSHRILWESSQQEPARDQLFHQFAALGNRYPEIHERLLAYHKQWDKTIVSLMQNGIDGGWFKPHDTFAVAQAITALYDGLHMRNHIDPEVDVVGVIEATTKLIYDALVLPQAKTVNGD